MVTADPDPGKRFEALLGARRATRDELDALFDGLAPVTADAMLGRWSGLAFATGDAWQRLLRRRPLVRWHGKRFRGPDRVNALVVSAFGLRFAAPLGAAVLRPIEFRGTLSTAMIYCWLPIIDHFRAVDADTLMGVMETRGRVRTHFVLRREAEH
jgi:hypothetical protein